MSTLTLTFQNLQVNMCLIGKPASLPACCLDLRNFFHNLLLLLLLLLSRVSCATDSVQPHRRQPTRLHCLWDSPGKNTGVGCHFLPQCMKVKSQSEVAQSCLTQRPHGLQPTRLLRPWDFPGQSTGVGCHCLLQGVSYLDIIQGKS